ncbi:aldehyde dehydrogenase family protein [Runella sp. CRIBMP]|uniref:aldehyde dehydrogenase family protein n=1 Tax=Runella sp. CRIBMP TaxID=2683261 RepID=UPI001413493E|nr:aldehyde dehydrogenase family protein [Runella sp. CRIBMP]NBB18506.1 aldehyde dehydrogenase family protein [Runella sp. CRIBMP]
MITAESTLTRDLQRVFDAQRKNAVNVALTNADERAEKLKVLLDYLMAHLPDVEKAMYDDFRKPAVEVLLGEVYTITSEIKFARKNLKNWMKPQRVPTPLGMIGTSNYIKHEPKGNVLIISPWNYPLALAIKPLISAIAAGNVAMLKPSELTPHTSRFLKKMINDLFAEEEVAVFEGDVEVATELLKLPFNHIFFTGAPTIGKIVMRAAADHLASVTLELGGKSPNIIDETADIKKAAEMTAWSKGLNNGQTCIAVDYVMIHASKIDEFITSYRAALQKMYSEGAEKSDSYARIVNNRHFNRLKGYLDDAIDKGASVVVGGKTLSEQNYVEPTLLTNVSDEMKIMQDEIFGPLLPVLTYQNKEEVIAYVNGKEKPLALYIHSTDSKNIDYFLNNTTAGDTVINDVMIQFGNAELPFGGVNNSGIGKSNGYFGFQEFSNLRGVSKRQFGTMKFLYPPYTANVRKIIDLFVKYF